jgi:hypothetical protein
VRPGLGLVAAAKEEQTEQHNSRLSLLGRTVSRGLSGWDA